MITIIIHNVKILDRDSYTRFINNKVEDILNILEESPIVAKINDKDTVIGFITNPYLKDKMFYGDIYLYPMNKDYFKSKVLSQELMFEDDKKHRGEIILKDFALHVEPLSK